MIVNRPGNKRRDIVEEINEVLIKRFGPTPPLKEAITPLSKDTSTGIYTGGVADWVQDGFEPELVATKVMKSVGMEWIGENEVKVPYSYITGYNADGGVGVISAAEIGDTGQIATNTSMLYGYGTVALSVYGVLQVITQEMIDVSSIDILQDTLKLMGYGLAKQADTLILAALNVATPADDSENNYEALGATTNISWDKIRAEQEVMMEFNTRPNLVVVNPTNYKILVESMDHAPGYKFEEGRDFPRVFHGATELVVSSLVAAKTTYIISPRDCGYLIHGKVKVKQGDYGATLARQLFAYQKMGATVIQKQSVSRLIDNTAP